MNHFLAGICFRESYSLSMMGTHACMREPIELALLSLFPTAKVAD